MSEYLTPLPHLRRSLFTFFDEKRPVYRLNHYKLNYISKTNFLLSKPILSHHHLFIVYQLTIGDKAFKNEKLQKLIIKTFDEIYKKKAEDLKKDATTPLEKI